MASNGQVSNAVLMGIVPSVAADAEHRKPGWQRELAGHPAKAGSVITIYVSGLGQTNPPGDDGLVNANPLPVPLAAVTVYFPATPSAVTPQFLGAAAGNDRRNHAGERTGASYCPRVWNNPTNRNRGELCWR